MLGLALLVALVAAVVTERRRCAVRAAGGRAAAAIGVLGLAIAAWLGPLLVAALVALLWRARRPAAHRGARLGVRGGRGACCRFPVVQRLGDFLVATEARSQRRRSSATSSARSTGSRRSASGPTGDYRIPAG